MRVAGKPQARAFVWRPDREGPAACAWLSAVTCWALSTLRLQLGCSEQRSSMLCGHSSLAHACMAACRLT